MKKIIILISIFYLFHQNICAACSYSGDDQKINFDFKNVKLISDDTIPAGTVLAVKKVGGNVGLMKKFSNCSSSDVYAVIASAGLVEAPGVRGVQGGTVYETGIPGIGFQISDAISGTNLRPVPAIFQTIPAQGLSSGSVEQITVWLIKTRDNIDVNETGNNATVLYKAGPANQIQKNDYLLLTVRLAFGPFTYKKTSCNITSRNGGTVTLSSIEAKALKSKASGAKTDSEKEINIDISCPDDSVGSSYIYWFNPITPNSLNTNGVLINNIRPEAGGAENVGIIIKKDSTPIKFYDYSTYKFPSIKKNESITLTADYYKTSSTVGQGEVHAIFEVILQEQ